MLAPGKKLLLLKSKLGYTNGNVVARAGKTLSSVITATPPFAAIASVDIKPTPIFDPTLGEYALALANPA